MRYFVVSDLHGHYDEFMDALTKNHFDEKNDNHHLIVVGDMFDRGTQSREIFHYLYELHLHNKVTIILGNHDTFMIEFLEGKYLSSFFNIEHNGFGKTLESFSGLQIPTTTDLDFLRDVITREYPTLYGFLKSLPYYYELDKYIFVHGGLDGTLDDWKQTSIRDMIWSFEYLQAPIPDKIVVAGHHRVATIGRKNCDYNSLYRTNPECFDIMHLTGKILIDGFVEVSKHVNVLTLDI